MYIIAPYYRHLYYRHNFHNQRPEARERPERDLRPETRERPETRPETRPESRERPEGDQRPERDQRETRDLVLDLVLRPSFGPGPETSSCSCMGQHVTPPPGGNINTLRASTEA